MLGPVIIDNLFSSLSKYVSFSTNTPVPSILSITGCLPPLMSKIPELSTFGLQ